MSTRTNDRDRPMAEPGKSSPGADVGGVAASIVGGVADSTQRSMERGDDPAVGRASSGDAGGGAADPRLDLGGKAAPGSANDASSDRDRPRSEDSVTARRGTVGSAGSAQTSGGSEDDGDEWRHEPVPPVDERNPLKSFGRAVADTLTGGAEDTSRKPER